MPPDAVLPFNLLVGPLLRAHYLGDWLGHPQIRAFTAPEGVAAYHREVMEPAWYAFPNDTLALPWGRAYTWAELWAQLPSDWVPDLLIWWGFYFPLPVDFGNCPCPLVVIAADWHVHLPAILAALPHCEQIWGDRALLQALPAHAPAAYWPSYGWAPALTPAPASERDLAISFVGNLQPATYAARNRLLRRVAAVAGTHKCWMGSQLYNHDYAGIFARSRIVFNHSLRGEMNMRAYEAAASGALLFLEDSNLEVREILPDACVLYNDSNLESLLTYYLENPEAATLLAQRGQAQIQAHTYTDHLGLLLAHLKKGWPELRLGHRRRQARSEREHCFPLPGRLQHALSLHFPSTHQLALTELTGAVSVQALGQTYHDAWHATALAHHALHWLHGDRRQQALQEAISLLKPHASQSLALRHNLAWLLLWAGEPGAAVQLAVAHIEAAFQTQEPGSLSASDELLAPWAALLLPLGYSSRVLQDVRLQVGDTSALEGARQELFLWNVLWLGGQAFAQLGQWAQAQEWLETAVRWRPHLPEPYPALAQACLQQGRWEAAEAAMRQGLSQGALYPALQLGLIRLLGAQGRFAEAQTELHLAQSLCQGPDGLALRQDLARLARKLRRA